MKKGIILLFLSISFYQLSAQKLQLKSYKTISYGFNLGVNSFYGDIKNKSGFYISSQLHWQILPLIAIYSELGYSNLKGNNALLKNKFNNNTIRTTIGCEAFLFHIIDYQPISKYLQPYGGISIGFLKSNVNQSTLENTAIKTKYNDWAFLYTYQLGTKINLTHRIKIQLQTNLNFTSSDWLDNYKPNVPANKKKDAFNEFTIGFTYLFGEKTKPSLLWDAPKDLVLIKTKKNNLKEEIQETKIKVTEPLYYDLKKVESADYNENEFDCIIKF